MTHRVEDSVNDQDFMPGVALPLPSSTKGVGEACEEARHILREQIAKYVRSAVGRIVQNTPSMKDGQHDAQSINAFLQDFHLRLSMVGDDHAGILAYPRKGKWMINGDGDNPGVSIDPSHAEKLDVVSPGTNDEFTVAQAPVVKELNEWLASLEGEKFLCEEAREKIGDIVHRVRKAGCELLYQDQPVDIYPTIRNQANHATIEVSVTGSKPQQRPYQRIKMPLLTVRPVS